MAAGPAIPMGLGRGIPQVFGMNGVVASASSIAPSIGLKVLMDGGNAIDAAITTATMITVADNDKSGIVGHGIMMMYWAKTGEVKCLDWGGYLPSKFTIDQWGTPPAPPATTSVLCTLVPGTLAGWAEALNKYGTISLAKALEPAIKYAEQGVPINQKIRTSIATYAELAPLFPEWAKIYMPEGRVPEVGEIIKLKDLANTYKLIAKEGPDVLYKGELGDKLIKYLNENGSRLSKEDLANYKPIWRDTISTTYRDQYEIFVPKNQNYSPVILTMLNIWENFDMKGLGLYTPESIHLMIEASKVGIADRVFYGDPDFSKVPYDILVSKPYAKRIADKINMKKATPIEELRPANLVEELAKLSSSGEGVTSNIVSNTGGATSNIAVVDKDHNVCVITQTLGGAYGTLHVVPGTGLTLFNEGKYFDLVPLNGANYPEAGKRVENQMGPAIVLKNGKIFIGLGSPGGTQIPQCIAKVLMLMLDHGLRIQEAIDAPRVRYVGGSVTGLEEGIPWEVREKLWQMGHDLTVATSFCGPSGVVVNPETGILEGGAEPFRNAFAVAY
jgi:gamma-glutamyltranspeptidase/glutathione hydrolase